MGVWKNIQSIGSFSVGGIHLFHLLVPGIILIMTLILRKKIVNLFIGMLQKIFYKSEKCSNRLFITKMELPAHFAIALLGIWAALEFIPLSRGVKAFWAHFLRSSLAFLIFWAVYRSVEVLAYILSRVGDNSGIRLSPMMISFIKSGIKVLVVTIGIIVIAQEWGYNAAGFIAGLGLGGLVIALAAKDTVANLFGSLMIMIDKPFEVGDWIMTPHVEGTVEDVGFRSTRVRTFAQALVTVPNSMMSNEPVTNWSRMGKRRINFRLGIAYTATSGQIKECVGRIREMLKNHTEVHSETVCVYFERFADNSLDIFVYLFTKTTEWQSFLEVQEDINLRIMSILEVMNIGLARTATKVQLNPKSKEGL
ncbi:MAG: mechanosensitive ion channel family protein [Clostridia bacterium]|nr:mechanosensitive ion channel family protein [Clostridia bacterium]